MDGDGPLAMESQAGPCNVSVSRVGLDVLGACQGGSRAPGAALLWGPPGMTWHGMVMASIACFSRWFPLQRLINDDDGQNHST
jgi:hypothetical protein